MYGKDSNANESNARQKENFYEVPSGGSEIMNMFGIQSSLGKSTGKLNN